nr:DUF4176 domain-containing protein [uncultured Ottowia sp.]
MDKSKELLPLGSVVCLEEGTQKLIIISRGVFEDSDSSEQVFADYMGTLYPSGFQKIQTFSFDTKILTELSFAAIRTKKRSAFWRSIIIGRAR